MGISRDFSVRSRSSRGWHPRVGQLDAAPYVRRVSGAQQSLETRSAPGRLMHDASTALSASRHHELMS